MAAHIVVADRTAVAHIVVAAVHIAVVPVHTVAAAVHIAVVAAHTAIAALHNSPEVADLVVAHMIVAADWDHSS